MLEKYILETYDNLGIEFVRQYFNDLGANQ